MTWGHRDDEKKDKEQQEKDQEKKVSWDSYYSIGDDGLEQVASDYVKDRFFTEEVEPPSYDNKIPIGRDWQSGEVFWMDVNDDDRIGIFGRCIHPDSRIRTDTGNRSIQEMFDEHAGEVTESDDVGTWFEVEGDFEIVTMNENGNFVWKEPSRFYRQEINSELVHLKLENGAEVEVTRNHPLMKEGEWAKSEDIDEGDRIAVPKEYPEIENCERLPEELNVEKSWMEEHNIETDDKKDVWWVKVKEKTVENYQGYVYDLTVPETHNFVFEEILGKNTGAGKCLHKNDTAHTNKGRLSTSEIFEKYSGKKQGEDNEGEWFDLPDDFKVASLEDGDIVWKSPSVIYREDYSGELLKVRLQDGSSIRISKSHPLLTENGWTDGANLEEGEQVAVPEDNDQPVGTGKSWSEIREIETIEYNDYIYDLTVPETHNFVAEDVVAHNTFLTKAIISRLWKGDYKIIHLSDVKNDFIDLDHGDGIQKHHMNLLENEERTPIPVNMYMPKFMEDEYHPKPPQKDNFHPFAYGLDDLSESDFLQLVGADTQAKKDLAMRVYDSIENEGNESFKDLYDLLEELEDDYGKRTRRSIKSSLEGLERQKVVSNRYQKEPTDTIEDSVVSLALEHWDKYKRKSLEKVEVQIAITIRKVLDQMREGELDGPLCMVVDEAHTFVPRDGNSVSRDDIVDVVDLGRAYGIPMIFSTQRVSQIPEEAIINQMNKFFIDKTLSNDDRKKLLQASDIFSFGDRQKNKWNRVFRQMKAPQHKMFIDKKKGEWTVLETLSPLCSHK